LNDDIGLPLSAYKT